jgi:restriction endonuclease S subunit
MSDYPLDWQRVRIGDLLIEHSERSSTSSQHEVLSVTKDGIFSQREYFKKQIASEDNTGYKVVKKGDVVFSAMNLWMGSIDVVKDYQIGIVSPAYITMRPNQQVADTEFLSYFLRGDEMRKRYIQHSQQGASIVRRNLNKDDLLDDEIAIPQLPEQKKIAEILSGIDRCIQAEVNIESKITKQYQGVLSRIFDDVSKEIPLGDYLPLGDLNLDISDGNYSAKYPSASEFVERGVPFIRASNMKEGTIDDKDMRFISTTKHQEITKGHLKSGDILIANRGEIGKTSRVPARHIGSNINAQVVRINGGKKIDSSFLFHYLSSPFCQTLIDELTTGTALKQLPIGNLVKLLIPAPEMSVQIAIGGALDSMQRVMNAISEKSRKRSQLKQAVATELLSGRKRVSI